MSVHQDPTVYWDCNPPPPGTELEDVESLPLANKIKGAEKSIDHSASAAVDLASKGDFEDIVPSKDKNDKERSSGRSRRHRSRSGSVDQKYHRMRSRSHSRRRKRHSKDKRRRSRSRSHSRNDSRERRKRSRSWTRRRRHSSYSRSRSNSRHSRSRSRSTIHRRHKKSHRRHSSRCFSQSRSRSRSPSTRPHRRDRSSRSPKVKNELVESQYFDEELLGSAEDMIVEEEAPETNPVPFKNDGSFLEMFKKMQEMQQMQQQQQQIKTEPGESSEPKKPLLPVFGKRRGGKVLKTGIVQKVRNIEEDQSTSTDPWSVYMKEVRKYKEVHCDDDSKTRPLVK